MPIALSPSARGMASAFGRGFAVLATAFVITALTSCGQGTTEPDPAPTPGVEATTPAPAAICVPSLASPANGATLDNGRLDHADQLVWEFDWSDCAGASSYHIYVKHGGSASAFIDKDDLGDSSYRHSNNGYVASSSLAGWTWKVRAKVGTEWGAWSAERSFEVEPPDSDSSTTCVPTLVAPSDGATLDNGRTDGADDIVWDFDWSDCPGATKYHLYVKTSAWSGTTIDKDDVTSSSYHYLVEGAHFPGDRLRGWQWKVRAFVGGSWGSWSASRSFQVEPPNIDPGPACIPTLTSPASGATLDNGRIDHTNGIVWDFNWWACPGATQYHLYVAKTGSGATIDRDDIAVAQYRYTSTGYIASHNLTGWTWRVRARVDGSWNSWSAARPFQVEPPNTD